VSILVWARGGPLASGWAARAGTPKSLLFSSRARLSARRPRSSPVAPVPATLPPGSFEATFNGRLRDTSAGDGLVKVRIDGRTTGGFRGRVHVALRGSPLPDGGVQMVDSTVGLLPSGATAWLPGRVVGLSGQQILADVQRPNGHQVRVLMALQIDRASGSVHGILRSDTNEGAAE
jgi:hypothetical protein